MSFIAIAASLIVGVQSPPPPGSGTDWVIPAGVTVVHSGGEIDVHDLVIEAGATLRLAPDLSGIVQLSPIPSPLHIRASGTIRIDGTLDASGYAAPDASFFPSNLRQRGGLAVSGSQRGGTGNPIDWDHCPAGNPGGIDVVGPATSGAGLGGESGVGTASDSLCRPGGGGGGALAANQSVHVDPDNDANIGRIAQAGRAGGSSAFGAISLVSPPPGGLPGTSLFLDANPLNDFFGSKIDPITLLLITGELSAPVAGFGGGGGGNRITGSTFPPATAWSPEDFGTELGAGGGAGGGLVLLESVFIVLGPTGRIVSDGGAGGSGENTNGMNRIGAGGGGGSGGMIVLQARRVDLRLASPNAITALGGRGGKGAGNVYGATCAGGNGGPGIVQIHVPNEATNLVLPIGATLPQLTAPTAYVLNTVPGL